MLVYMNVIILLFFTISKGFSICDVTFHKVSYSYGKSSILVFDFSMCPGQTYKKVFGDFILPGKAVGNGFQRRSRGKRKSMPSGGQISWPLPGKRNLDDFSCLVAKKSVLEAPIFYHEI